MSVWVVVGSTIGGAVVTQTVVAVARLTQLKTCECEAVPHASCFFINDSAPLRRGCSSRMTLPDPTAVALPSCFFVDSTPLRRVVGRLFPIQYS